MKKSCPTFADSTIKWIGKTNVNVVIKYYERELAEDGVRWSGDLNLFYPPLSGHQQGVNAKINYDISVGLRFLFLYD